MSLEDDLKGKAVALVSQHMATWAVSVQREVSRHQEALVRALDQLSEDVARYDEHIDEAAIARAIVEGLASQPAPSAPSRLPALQASIAAIERGMNLSEVLTSLVNEASGFMERVAIFIVKGTSAIGWYSRGFEPPDAVKQITTGLTSEPVFQHVASTRRSWMGAPAEVAGPAHALARLGGRPATILAVPLMLREKLAAILYGDTTESPVPPDTVAALEILVAFSAKVVDVLSSVPRTAAARTSAPPGQTAAPAAAATTTPPAPVMPPPAAMPPPAVTPPPAAAPDQGASTVMFNPSQMAEIRQQVTTTQAPRPPAFIPPPAPPPPPPAALTPEVQKAHEEAKRFARLVVSEIKLYNETKVNEGRRHHDLYDRLKEDIERGRQMYQERVSPLVRDSTNYFYDELVRILAGGDPTALGQM
jgi:hypothetical protein